MESEFNGNRQLEEVSGSRIKVIDVEMLLNAAIDGLTNLDAQRLEELVATCEQMTTSVTYIEAAKGLDARQVLKCLLEHTRRNMKLLSIRNDGCEGYARPSYEGR